MDQFRILKVLAAMDDVDANQACVDQGLTSYGTLTGKGHKMLKQSRQSGVPFDGQPPFMIITSEQISDEDCQRVREALAQQGMNDTSPYHAVILEPLTSAQLTLALMRLKCWATRRGEDGEEVESNVRASTRFTYRDLEVLHNAGMVEASAGAKTAKLLPAGLKTAEEILAGMGVPVPEIVVREV